VPHGDDDLPWDRVAACDAVYFTGGDVAALQRARAARILVATPRARDALVAGGVQLDVLVASATDEGERIEGPRPGAEARRPDSGRGRWAVGGRGRGVRALGPGRAARARPSTPTAAATRSPPRSPSPSGRDLDLDAALAFAACCGAHVLTGRGPYGSGLPPAP
jgi:ribokinase